ncbi:MAG: DUF2332 domain-containing protein [Chloroflexota bacterium]|nr:MAG: DUF2332 domain-containing protein [Chloroflexota bacterium]
MSQSSPPEMSQDLSRVRLAAKFRDQEDFSRDYSPLYARLFGLVASWLEAPEADDDWVANWLVAAGRDRRSLEVTLLLAAGLHRDVLASEPAARELRRFFPTVGGAEPLDSPELDVALRQAILARPDVLAEFIRDAQVQTNETGRGLSWLLPLLLTGWPSVRLVDFGASAGLNLVAEQRAYRLLEADSRTTLLDLGLSRTLQFQTLCYGWQPNFSGVNGRTLPHIVARDGCDLVPFPLKTRHDELTLMAFVWGDQVNRLTRLQEGIAAFKQVDQSDAPVRLTSADLPDELTLFLRDSFARQLLMDADSTVPVVIYNTWMTSYLRDKGQSMAAHIDQWATGQKRPVLWLQWEPPRDGSQPPHYGWCAWTADLWRGEERNRWHFGWIHPHGGEARLGRGLEEWRRFWSD